MKTKCISRQRFARLNLFRIQLLLVANKNYLHSISILPIVVVYFSTLLLADQQAPRLIIDTKSFVIHTDQHHAPGDTGQHWGSFIDDGIGGGARAQAYNGWWTSGGGQQQTTSARSTRWQPRDWLQSDESGKTTTRLRTKPKCSNGRQQQQQQLSPSASKYRAQVLITKTNAKPLLVRPKAQLFARSAPPTNGIIVKGAPINGDDFVEPFGSAPPLGTVGRDKPTGKCALILQRTFVRRVANELDGGTASLATNHQHQEDQQADLVEPTGQLERVCITYDDVNRAIGEAKKRRKLEPNEPKLATAIKSIEPEPPFISQLGELNQEVTKILADEYDLSADEILNGLPLIDMSRTDFWSLCPLMVKPIQCDPTGRFRAFTGHCNNLKNPSWGAAQTPFVRFLAPRHPDGIEQDRVSVVDGSALPAARLVSSTIHRDFDQPSGELSLLIMVWGQVIDHDVALAAPPRGKWAPNGTTLGGRPVCVCLTCLTGRLGANLHANYWAYEQPGATGAIYD